MKPVVYVFKNKETRLEERNRARLSAGQKLLKVWDILDRRYLDGCIKILLDKNGNVGRILEIKEDFSIDELTPVTRYLIEEWV